MPSGPTAKQFQQLEDVVRGVLRRIANLPARWTPPPPPGVVEYFALINGAVEETTDSNIFHYGHTEAMLQEASDGTETWVITPNGRTGDSANPDTYARNMDEAPNSSAGTQGNGVDIDTVNTGYSLQPIPDGVVVLIRLTERVLETPDESKPKKWRPVFRGSNSLDGDCI